MSDDPKVIPRFHMIQLCNQTNSDIWINIPGPIREGNTVEVVYFPGLNPNLKVYIEVA